MTEQTDVSSDQKQTSRPYSKVALAALCVAVLAAISAMFSGFGSRWGVWNYSTGFSILRWSADAGIAAGVLGLIGLVRARPGASRRGLWAAGLGLIVAAVVVAVPWSFLRTARSVPSIHDITTDTENPPEFVAVRPLRANAPNPAEYGGEEIARQQREGYPNLGPAHLEMPPSMAFERALEAARDMEWDIVAAEPSEGRIEATATTFWYGFKDDVVVRVRSADGGSRIDVRSVSRVGRSDVGKNAARIREYLRRLEGSG